MECTRCKILFSEKSPPTPMTIASEEFMLCNRCVNSLSTWMSTVDTLDQELIDISVHAENIIRRIAKMRGKIQ